MKSIHNTFTSITLSILSVVLFFGFVFGIMQILLQIKNSAIKEYSYLSSVLNQIQVYFKMMVNRFIQDAKKGDRMGFDLFTFSMVIAYVLIVVFLIAIWSSHAASYELESKKKILLKKMKEIDEKRKLIK